MNTTEANIQIESNKWNELFLIARLDENRHILEMNQTFQSIVYEQLQGQQPIDHYFQPLLLSTRKYIEWQTVWQAVKESGSWRGYIYLTAFRGSRILLYVTFLWNKDRDCYDMIGDDRTAIYHEFLEHYEQLRELTYMKEAVDKASIIAITDSKGVITYVNDMFCQISQYDRSELIGNTHRIINSKHHPKQFFADMWSTISQGKTWRGEVKNQAKDGSFYWMKTTIVPFMDEFNKPYQYVSIRSDITDRVIAETELAHAIEHDFRRMIKALQNCIFKIEKNSRGDYIFTLSEGKIAEELSFTTENIANKTLDQLWSDDYEYVKRYYDRAFAGTSEQFEVNCGKRYFYISLSPIAKNGQVHEVIASMIDITERKQAEETIHYLAHYDALTNLPNRTSFSRELQHAIDTAKLDGSQIAVLFIDLDRFKIINDTMGHTVGDDLLQQVAQRLQNSVSRHGYVSRQGGDEFTLLLKQADRQKAMQLAERIIANMAEPFILQGTEVFVTPSIGISMFPDDGETIEELLKCADAAMYHAKDMKNVHVYFFTEELHRQITGRLELERDLRKAIDRGQLELWYQPKMNVWTNQLIGMEALLRWNHPKLGLVAPNHFIQIAEESNLIQPIGEWVLIEACRQMKEWLTLGIDSISVAVNISFRQFSDHDFPDHVASVLEETNLPPQYLELEITESVAQNAQFAIGALKKIKQLGVSVSIDDFGTGYSSLSYLSQFPIDRLKIDQSFVRNLDASNQAIIRTIMDIANHMNIKVIAEGVETEEQVDFLKQYNCQEAQGYYYSKPMNKAESSIYIGKYSKSCHNRIK